MPSINFDPARLPTRSEARALLPSLKDRARSHPDATSDDWLLVHLVQAYVEGKLVEDKD